MNIILARIISITLAILVMLLLSIFFKLNFIVMLISFTVFRTLLYIFDKINEKW